MAIWQPVKVENQFNISSMFSLFYTHYDKTYRFAGETHNFWECVYVISGSICASGDEQVYNLNAGDIIFHKPLELHKFSVTHQEGATLLIFSFSLSGPMCEYLENKVFSLNNEQKAILSALRSFLKTSATPVNKDCGSYVMEQYLESVDTPVGYLQNITTYFYQLFLSLADRGSVTASLTTPGAMIFKQAVRYMLNNISQQPSVSEIAKHCAVSESGLKRIFTKYAGLSVHKYFLTLKLQTAAKLLQNGKNATEVTELLNFSSQSYFSVAFKRETGKSPSQIKSNN